ncbi:MAG: low temperature-induced protein [Chloroflexota bacterium]|nr:low temperature-induced protein [Chloroflexota bacterium]
MRNNNHVAVVGIFRSPADAQMAIDRLQDSNIDVEDVSVIERDPERYDATRDYTDIDYDYQQYTVEEFGDETLGGLVIGGLAGGTLGALAGLGALTIPGIGPIVAAGPLVGALTGGATGAVAGTVVGALVEAFQMPEEHAETYRDRLAQGATMVAAHVEPRYAPQVQEIFREANAEQFEWSEPPARDRRYYWV